MLLLPSPPVAELKAEGSKEMLRPESALDPGDQEVVSAGKQEDSKGFRRQDGGTSSAESRAGEGMRMTTDRSGGPLTLSFLGNRGLASSRASGQRASVALRPQGVSQSSSEGEAARWRGREGGKMAEWHPPAQRRERESKRGKIRSSARAGE